MSLRLWIPPLARPARVSRCWRATRQGHVWTETFGTLGNGTTYKEKSLQKDQFWKESTGWNSEGKIWGSRQGLTDEGKGWQEEWSQTYSNGVTAGSLRGSNEHNETCVAPQPCRAREPAEKRICVRSLLLWSCLLRCSMRAS